MKPSYKLRHNKTKCLVFKSYGINPFDLAHFWEHLFSACLTKTLPSLSGRPTRPLSGKRYIFVFTLPLSGIESTKVMQQCSAHKKKNNQATENDLLNLGLRAFVMS